MTVMFDWQPEPNLLEQLTALAVEKGQSAEALVTEAVSQYLQSQLPIESPSQPSLTLEQRQAFLKLPIAQRRQILQEQSVAMLPHYQNNLEWQELQTGD